MRIKNIFTGMVYEFIKYEGYDKNLDKVKQFIRDNYNYSIRVIRPIIEVSDLVAHDEIEQINEGDFVIRTCKKMPLYNVISKEIFENNFTVID